MSCVQKPGLSVWGRHAELRRGFLPTKEAALAEPYLDGQVRVEQDLKVERLTALVLYVHLTFQFVLSQGDTVDQTEIIRPLLLHTGIQHRTAQSKVQLDATVGFTPYVLARALPQKLPVAIPREPVLW